MDVRSRELGKNTMTSRRGDVIKDWDARVTDRIQKLTPTEIGYQRVSAITINGKAQKLIEHETILEVQLTNPIALTTSSPVLYEVSSNSGDTGPLYVRFLAGPFTVA
jgi:hypothetical protein